MKSASVGTLTPQKTANATNQRFSSSVEPVVKYHHTATSIPNIFKSSCMFHFLWVVLNWVGFRTRARMFKKGQLWVFWKRSHAIWCCTQIYHQSHSNIPKTPFYVSCIGRWFENRDVLMSLSCPTPWNSNGNFGRGHRAVGFLWEDRHTGFAPLIFPILEKSQCLILLCLPQQFFALCIVQSLQVGAHSTTGLAGHCFLKKPGHGFLLFSFFQSFYSSSCYS